MKRILVLQHISYEPAGLFARFAREQGIEMDVVELFRSERIPPIRGYDGLVVMGGPMGVNDNYPGEVDELKTVVKAVGKIPVLGICLGSQLLASALGARVYPNVLDGKRTKEIGYYSVDLTGEGMKDPIFRGLESPLKVLQWHGDAFDLPEGAKLLATAPTCLNQAFIYRKNGIPAYGLLFHLEATPEMVDEWIKNDNGWRFENFDFNDEEVRRQAKESAALMERHARRLFANFLTV